MQRHECEFYLAINEDGGFVVCKDEEDALSKLGEDEGGYYGAVYKFTATVPAAGPRNFKIEIPEETEEKIELKAEELKAA
jgi:hypothetical protein